MFSLWKYCGILLMLHNAVRQEVQRFDGPAILDMKWYVNFTWIDIATELNINFG